MSRIHRRLRCLAIAVSALAFGTGSTVAAAPPGAVIRASGPCELARRIVFDPANGRAAGGMIYDVEPFRAIPLAGDGRRAPAGAPLDLLNAWDARGASNLLDACPRLRARLPPWVRLANDGERAALKGLGPGPTLVQASAPITDASGRHVAIEVRSRCPGLCGLGTVRHFRKTPRGWEELPTLALWMS